jgi:hypothetical protein
VQLASQRWCLPFVPACGLKGLTRVTHCPSCAAGSLRYTQESAHIDARRPIAGTSTDRCPVRSQYVTVTVVCEGSDAQSCCPPPSSVPCWWIIDIIHEIGGVANPAFALHGRPDCPCAVHGTRQQPGRPHLVIATDAPVRSTSDNDALSVALASLMRPSRVHRLAHDPDPEHQINIHGRRFHAACWLIRASRNCQAANQFGTIGLTTIGLPESAWVMRPQPVADRGSR